MFYFITKTQRLLLKNYSKATIQITLLNFFKTLRIKPKHLHQIRSKELNFVERSEVSIFCWLLDESSTLDYHYSYYDIAIVCMKKAYNTIHTLLFKRPVDISNYDD